MRQRNRRAYWVRRVALGAVMALVNATCCDVASGQQVATAVAARPTTVWNWLGIPQGVHRVQDAVVNRCGLLPGLERKPPLLRIADPALAEVDNAAIKKAQQIKAEEDLAPQKIKAIKYLATLGCEKCYGGIEEAMLESLKDCTEKVRYETVQALAATADDKCPQCDNDCCSEKIVAQLAKMAYERDGDHPDCWFEPSARVRRAAQETLRVCCCNRPPPSDATGPEQPQSTTPPVEGGDPGVPVESGGGDRAATWGQRHDDLAMAVHVAPRRSWSADAAPEPTQERHLVAGRFVDERVQAAAFHRPQPDEPRHVAAPRYVRNDRHTSAQRSGRAPGRANPQPAPLPPRTNTYGRRYVTWGVPHGDYVPPQRPEPRPVVRRGILD